MGSLKLSGALKLFSECHQRYLQPLSTNITQTRFRTRIYAPPISAVKKYTRYRQQELSDENEAFVRRRARRSAAKESPLKIEPYFREDWERYTSKRTGLLAKKIGVIPQWSKDAKRSLVTLLQVLDNHVISYESPEDWFRNSRVGRKKAFSQRGMIEKFGKCTVGAIPADVQKLTAPYIGLFEKSGVGPKKRLASFMVSENARIEPGTRLTAEHFMCGQYVNITGRTIDWGNQGVMHRWGFKGSGGKGSWSNDRSRRRAGATGKRGDGAVRLGKRMAGHMGYEWKRNVSIKILRINHKYQVLYLRGCVLGETGDILLVNDCWTSKKEVEYPPFPTYYPEPDRELPYQSFAPEMHVFGTETIRYDESDSVNIGAILRKKEIKKQAKAKR